MRFATIFALAAAFVRLQSVRAEVPALHVNHQSFADELTDELYSNDNECTSAWGVSMAFSLVYPASIGESTEQIRDVLGYPNGTQHQLVWNDTATRMDNMYEGACLDDDDGECTLYAPTLEIANSIWVDDDSTLNSTYQDVVGSFVRLIDFQADTAGGIVNDWVNDTTNGLIDSVLEEGPIDAALVAVNSIYLNASWSAPFSERYTNEDFFYSSISRATARDSEAHFMHKVAYFFYSHVALPGYQVVRLPFVQDLSMLFVLPMSETSGSASSIDLIAAFPQLERTRLALAIPKFKFESTYKDSLKESLQTLGITRPFLPGTLCILENTNCLEFIEIIIQKTFIDVNEEGVEAAAVTVIVAPGVAPGTPPPEPDPILYLADHPFQFFIFDENEQLVIFEGRTGDPGIPDGAGPAQLQAAHTDSDFWSDTFDVDPVEPDPTLTPGPLTPEPSPTEKPDPTLTPAPLTPEPSPTEKPTEDPSSSFSVTEVGSLWLGFVCLVVGVGLLW